MTWGPPGTSSPANRTGTASPTGAGEAGQGRGTVLAPLPHRTGHTMLSYCEPRSGFASGLWSNPSDDASVKARRARK